MPANLTNLFECIVVIRINWWIAHWLVLSRVLGRGQGRRIRRL
jgi:hypothetical protein